ncbi:SDR family oxidoreductase [Afifella sp. IM 167]|uniref:SDR family oxidoreductase n=1 Tax=Afifella sp. IM 167 TaxID=2033586 RepID=UPI001CCBCBD3|nr:SDR family oxidoreductase [Afifella sp. IM 167]MBZ8131957.1 3-oxoacyl-ACP reductase [Afifella sp. IM 167]
MDLEIKDRVAVVLGAGGGLGSAVASRLSAEGARVALCDINEDALAATAAAIREAGGEAETFVWDLGESDRAAEVMASIKSAMGPIDILFNNTGGPPPTPVAGQDAALWTKSFSAMVLSVIQATDAVLPDMRARGFGRIVTSTSSGVVAPIPNLGLSNTLRASLVAWSKTLAREVGGDGITVNVVVPGRIGTARTAFLDSKKAEREGRSVDEVSRDSCALIPVGRYGDPAEYASVVSFLASGLASYVTGSVVRVDGGLLANI